MKNILLIIFVIASMSLFAQTTIETQLVVTTNAGTNGGAFQVAIQAKGTGLTANNTIGSATIDVNYNAADIAPVIIVGTNVQGTYDATIGSNYTHSLSNVVGGPFIRLTVAGSNINGNFDGTPVGLNLTATYQTLATINFTILNSSATTSLTIATGSLTIGLFNSPNNSNFSGIIVPQTMSAPINTINPLPVELSSFNSAINGREVKLSWETKTEKNTDKFEIQRSTTKEVNTWASVGSVQASYSSNSPKHYLFTEKILQSGNYQYRLKMIDNDGKYEYSKTIEATVALPKNYELGQNYPNPFNPNTNIIFQLPINSHVTLKVYNMLGQEVAELLNADYPAGYKVVAFDASKLSSGTYLYRLEAGNFAQIKKMIVLK
jgi:hypothetical protein